jgi:hypothetical protein
VATELRARDRDAVTVASITTTTTKDPALLQLLRDRFAALDQAWVMVTADDRMPDEHPDDIRTLTVATIDPRWEGRWPTQEGWKRETVARWAHRMAVQNQGAVRRYSPFSNRLWSPLR